MRIVRHYYSTPPEARGAVAAIGNFDGIHRGHQAVIAAARTRAREDGRPAAVLSFEPHPRRLFRPNDPPFRLTSFRVKARLLRALGIDWFFAQAFNRGFAALDADTFVRAVLHDGLGLSHCIVGPDFRFGRGRAGTTESLVRHAARLGIGTTVLEPVRDAAGDPFSSTLVRQCVAEGAVTRAAAILGRYWEIEGRIRTGRQLGRTIGFPTANIGLGDTQRPAFGVYAVQVCVGDCGAWWGGIANVGVRPTVDGRSAPLLEVHLFDFDGDLYGRHARVVLVDHIRAERKFDGLDALKAQIAADCDTARRMLAETPISATWPALA